MRVARFFEKFDQLADTNNAVPRIRELVLRLATSGRLTEPNSFDKPSSELLAEISAIRDQLVGAGKARDRTNGSMIRAGDTMEISDSWQRCSVADVCDLQTGATPSTQESSYYDGDIPWLVSGDVNKGEIFECDGRISELGLKNSNCKIIPRDSVLIALNGQGKTRATVALLRINAALNQSLVAMIPYSREHLLPEYLFWNLRGRYYAIREITGQDQRRGLNMKLVGQLSIPLPPVAEQQRIVKRVNELMVLCDRLEAEHEEREVKKGALSRASQARFADGPTPASLDLLFHDSYSTSPDDLRKTILTLAVQGRLVPQDPKDDLASSTLEECGVDLKQEAVPNDERRHPVPASWEWVRFSAVGDQRLGKMLDAAKNRGDLKPYLRNTNVQWMRFDLRDVKEMRIELEEVNELRLRKGDLLICEGGEPGRCAIWNEEVPEMYFQKALHRVRPLPAVLAEFLAINLQIDCETGVLDGYFTGATIKHLTGRSLSQYSLPIPPLAEQRRIVSKVDQLMSLVDDLRSHLDSSLTTGARLMDAFVNELTAQD